MTLNYHKCWNVLNELESVSSKICSAREILESAIDALEKNNKDKAEALMYATDEFLKYYLQDFDSKFKDAWGEIISKFDQEEWILDFSSKAKSDDVITFGDFNKLNNVWEEHYYPEEHSQYSEKTVDDGMRPWGHSDLEYLANSVLTEDRISNFPGEQYSEEELNAMCDKAASQQEKEKCREYNLREAEYYDKRAKLDTNKPKTYDEIIADGWEMTADGFLIKEEPTPPKEDRVIKWKLPVQVDGLTGECFIELPDDLLEVAGLKEGDVVKWEDNKDGTYSIIKETKFLKMDEC